MSSGPGHCLSKPLSLRLRSGGNVPSSVRGSAPLPLEPTSPVPMSREPGPRSVSEDRRTQGGQKPPGPAGGSELRQQTEAAGSRHCCPDFFSFWKLKLVRLFSFLFLSEIVSPGSACSRFQYVVNLESKRTQPSHLPATLCSPRTSEGRARPWAGQLLGPVLP